MVLYRISAVALSLSLTGCAIAGKLTIPLWPNGAPLTKALPNEERIEESRKEPGVRLIHKSIRPELTVHLPETKSTTPRAALIVCPGGAYRVLSIDKEGHDVARWCNKLGMVGIVLKYRMPRPDLTKEDTPLPLRDAHRAVQLVRQRAREWDIDPKRVGIAGFSAGGHLAATAATQFAKPVEGDPLSKVSSRPDFLILVYPVISMKTGIGHKGSTKNLLGKKPLPEMIEKYSAELHVSSGTAPTFLVHAQDDHVKIKNSELFHAACQKAGVAVGFHRFSKGGHGYGLGVRGGEVATWPRRCEAWLKKIGAIAPKTPLEPVSN